MSEYESDLISKIISQIRNEEFSLFTSLHDKLKRFNPYHKFISIKFPYLRCSFNRVLYGDRLTFIPNESSIICPDKNYNFEHKWVSDFQGHYISRLCPETNKNYYFTFDQKSQFNLLEENQNFINGYMKGNTTFSHKFEILPTSHCLNIVVKSNYGFFRNHFIHLNNNNNLYKIPYIILNPIKEEIALFYDKELILCLVNNLRDERYNMNSYKLIVDKEQHENIYMVTQATFLIDNALYLISKGFSIYKFDLNNTNRSFDEEEVVGEEIEFFSYVNLQDYNLNELGYNNCAYHNGIIYMIIHNNMKKYYQILIIDTKNCEIRLHPFIFPTKTFIRSLHIMNDKFYVIIRRELDYNYDFMIEIDIKVKKRIDFIPAFNDLEIIISNDEEFSSSKNIEKTHLINSEIIKENRIPETKKLTLENMNNTPLHDLENTPALFIKKYAEMKGHKLPSFTSEIYSNLKNNFSSSILSLFSNIEGKNQVQNQTIIEEKKIIKINAVKSSIDNSNDKVYKRDKLRKRKKNDASYLKEIHSLLQKIDDEIDEELIGVNINDLFI